MSKPNNPFVSGASTPLFQRPRRLNAYDAAALGVTQQSSAADAALKQGVKGQTLSGDSPAAAFEVIGLFPYQSYFDNTLGPQAILAQPPNELIIPSTRNQQQISGYAIGLHPSSETPVAVQFDTGASQGASPTYRLKPGETITPIGRPLGVGHPAAFGSFTWGLPFGWLGGGSATLVVFRTPTAKVQWWDRGEVLFHRIRLPILQPADITNLAKRSNWPTRFPWPFASFSDGTVTNIQQQGQPALAVTPTRTIMSLVFESAFAATGDMRMYMVGPDALALDDTGVIDNSQVFFEDYTWGTWTAFGGGDFASARETDTLNDDSIVTRLGCNYENCGVVLGDISGAGILDGMYVDFARFGVL